MPFIGAVTQIGKQTLKLLLLVALAMLATQKKLWAGGCSPSNPFCVDIPYVWQGYCVEGGCDTEGQFCCVS